MIRPADPQTRERILGAAREAFCARGYRVSVDRIAEQAGVAKQTVYNHFESKAELFSHVVADANGVLTTSSESTTGSLHERLCRFARAHRACALAPAGVALYRTLVAEATRFPAEARAVFEASAGAAHRDLTALLGDAIAIGELQAPSAEFAAEMLLSMLTGFERSRALFGLAAPEEDPPERVEWIVAAFLRAFAGNPSPGSTP